MQLLHANASLPCSSVGTSWISDHSFGWTPRQTLGMPWFARLLMFTAGACAIAVALHAFRDAERAAAEFQRFNPSLSRIASGGSYRFAAVVIGFGGLTFVLLAILVR